MGYRVQELLLQDGSSPYADWFNQLDAQGAAKVSVAKLRMDRALELWSDYKRRKAAAKKP